MTTPLYSLGAKLSVVVCRSTSSAVTPTCISWIPTRDKPWYLHRGKLPLHCISNLPLGVTNKGREAIKTISGAVAGDSNIQDRGVAHYLLSFLFSLVSLPFSFYFCVPNQKYQKYLLPSQLLPLWLVLLPLVRQKYLLYSKRW